MSLLCSPFLPFFHLQKLVLPLVFPLSYLIHPHPFTVSSFFSVLSYCLIPPFLILFFFFPLSLSHPIFHPSLTASVYLFYSAYSPCFTPPPSIVVHSSITSTSCPPPICQTLASIHLTHPLPCFPLHPPFIFSFFSLPFSSFSFIPSTFPSPSVPSSVVYQAFLSCSLFLSLVPVIFPSLSVQLD